MLKIEELLNLFSDDEAKKIILSSYMLSQKRNKELSNALFEHLFFMKLFYPNINIDVDYDSDDNSNYNPMTNTICLNGFLMKRHFFMN